MLEIFLTKDGSPTVLDTELDITYHSRHGALAESRHVFIEAGFKHAHSKFGDHLRILEIGFGTGLNTLLTLIESGTQNAATEFTSIEKFPLREEIWSKLNFKTGEDEYLFKLHEYEWNKRISITAHFSLMKIKMDALDFSSSEKFHCVYFDAFAPSSEEKLWSREMFVKLSDWMEEGACLVTFCAKGSVKRTMKECGFKVERLPGAPGKREMTRAIKT